MTTRRCRGILCLMVFLTGFPLPWGYAGEIVFKNQGPQFGSIVHEDQQTVTVRFSKDLIKSIDRNKKTLSSPDIIEQNPPDAAQIEAQEQQMKQLEKRIEQLEKKQFEDKKALSSPEMDPSETLSTTEQLLQEEMGSVSGVILWHNKPLANRDVRIRLERYTGSAWGAIKKMFSGDKAKSTHKKEIIVETRTDSQGGYLIENAPPGQYRLFWMPDNETGWIRRLREKPDFEVNPGELTIQNIPEKKK